MRWTRSGRLGVWYIWLYVYMFFGYDVEFQSVLFRGFGILSGCRDSRVQLSEGHVSVSASD